MKYLYEHNEFFRALIDTGTWGSATYHKELIHDYKKYTKSFPCPVRLTCAINEEDGVSCSRVLDGEVYLRVLSCFPQHGYVQVKVYYLPRLTGTVITEEYFIGIDKMGRSCYYGLTLQKFHSKNDVDINT